MEGTRVRCGGSGGGKTLAAARIGGRDSDKFFREEISANEALEFSSYAPKIMD